MSAIGCIIGGVLAHLVSQNITDRIPEEVLDQQVCIVLVAHCTAIAIGAVAGGLLLGGILP